jgi:uncharacterized damage-inducible protein DinB
MTTQPYSLLIDMKCWADRSLYDAVTRNLERLSREDVALMMRILDHMHVVDRIFQHHLQGRPHSFRAPRSEEIAELPALAHSVEETDEWYSTYVSGLTPVELAQPIDFTFTSGKHARMQRSQILLHVSLHGNYHRGNAGALLQLRGITPGRDGVTDFLAEEGAKYYGELNEQ